MYEHIIEVNKNMYVCSKFISATFSWPSIHLAQGDGSGERSGRKKGRRSVLVCMAVSRSASQLGLQQLRQLGRIGLAARGLHGLADQRVDGRFLAGAVLLDRSEEHTSELQSH